MKAKGILFFLVTLLAPEAVLRAADSDAILDIRLLPGIRIFGLEGEKYQIQFRDAFSALEGWKSLTELVLQSNGSLYIDTDSPGNGTRFYRAVRISATITAPPNPEPEKLVWIPAGKFVMGSPNNEVGRDPDEGPLTIVTLSRGFWMRKHEISQREYQSVMGINPSIHKGDAFPVENVTWGEANEYCARLTEQERKAGRLPIGHEYRLATEAEWEYACRAGTTTRFFWGDDPTYSKLGLYAWYSDNSSSQTHPVGVKAPNPWGLFDMHGNVAEWCLDLYSSSYPGGSVTDPLVLVSDDSRRRMRGGDAKFGPTVLRSANRMQVAPGVHYGDPNGLFNTYENFFGIRMVLATPVAQ